MLRLDSGQWFESVWVDPTDAYLNSAAQAETGLDELLRKLLEARQHLSQWDELLGSRPGLWPLTPLIDRHVH